ncbi:MAG: endonuclease/exonuclease/phosphatase family protein [Vicinamibacterales bacterium]
MAFTITTWNVQNFRQSDPVFADKLDFVVSILQALAPDVVALQEILDFTALQALANRLGFQAFPGTPDSRGNRVAMLTRVAPASLPQPIDQFRLAPGVVVNDFDANGNVQAVAQFPRPALQIGVTHNGRPVDVVTAHLKSKLLSFGGNFTTTNETLRAHTAYFALERRAAEATSIRDHVNGLLAAGRDVIVLGDLNDGTEAATTEVLYGPPGSQPRGPEDATHVSGAFQRADAQDTQRLYNVTKLVPGHVRWSRRHNGQNELLDHILASQSLMPRVGGLRQVPTVTILNEDTPNLLGPHPVVNGVIPDHAPVTATFV